MTRLINQKSSVQHLAAEKFISHLQRQCSTVLLRSETWYGSGNNYTNSKLKHRIFIIKLILANLGHSWVKLLSRILQRLQCHWTSFGRAQQELAREFFKCLNPFWFQHKFWHFVPILILIDDVIPFSFKVTILILHCNHFKTTGKMSGFPDISATRTITKSLSLNT